MPWAAASVQRPRRAPGVLGGLVFVAAVGAWFATSPSRHVPVPPATATPEQVVQAYLASSTAHDVATMNALSSGDFPRASRFRPTWMVNHVKTSPPATDPWVGEANHTWKQVV